MSEHRRFTSSSVLRGHPDKLCDRISDALVDAHLTVDTRARIRAEAAAAGQVIFVTTDAELEGEVDVNGVVRRTLLETGYNRQDLDPERCTILTQSSVMTPPWARERQDADEQPSGEQTTVFGYACAETPELMPLPIRVAQQIAGRLDELVGTAKLPGLAPDGSVQVTVEYVDDQPEPDRRRGPPGRPPGLAERPPRRPSRAWCSARCSTARPCARTARRGSSSTPRARRAWPARAATPATPAASRPPTPTAAPPATATAPSAARTRADWTAARRTPPATPPPTSSRPASPPSAS